MRLPAIRFLDLLALPVNDYTSMCILHHYYHAKIIFHVVSINDLLVEDELKVRDMETFTMSIDCGSETYNVTSCFGGIWGYYWLLRLSSYAGTSQNSENARKRRVQYVPEKKKNQIIQ